MHPGVYGVIREVLIRLLLLRLSWCPVTTMGGFSASLNTSAMVYDCGKFLLSLTFLSPYICSAAVDVMLFF